MMWILFGLVLLILIIWVVIYNGVVSMRQLVRNAWADVDVYLKRRAELIPNLAAAVKGYADHEAAVLTSVAEARAQVAALRGPERANAEQQVGTTLFNVFAVAESYPQLKADENFRNLQKELSETEKLIAHARQYYNACVRDYNIKLEAFPSSLVAATMGVRPESFFEVESPDERQGPSVSP